MAISSGPCAVCMGTPTCYDCMSGRSEGSSSAYLSNNAIASCVCDTLIVGCGVADVFCRNEVQQHGHVLGLLLGAVNVADSQLIPSKVMCANT
jgi:hypothetical protein